MLTPTRPRGGNARHRIRRARAPRLSWACSRVRSETWRKARPGVLRFTKPASSALRQPHWGGSARLPALGEDLLTPTCGGRLSPSRYHGRLTRSLLLLGALGASWRFWRSTTPRLSFAHLLSRMTLDWRANRALVLEGSRRGRTRGLTRRELKWPAWSPAATQTYRARLFISDSTVKVHVVTDSTSSIAIMRRTRRPNHERRLAQGHVSAAGLIRRLRGGS